jgi:HD-GYP domain-containing protein (c-di-GMP phosphodiesterase class II)
MLGTMLMDKRAIPWLLGLSALAVSGMSYLQSIGVVHPSINVHDVSNWLPIMIFLASASIMVWVNQDLQEKDRQQIHAFEQEVLFSYNKIIEGWRRALEMRDMDTASHSARVVELAARLAQATGLPEQQMIHFRNGAYLHDIGKIGVPDRVLLKPGPLNDEEWQMMRRHPELAHEMLVTIPYFQPALDIPRYHHEHWDGTGYPDHLQGEQIPLAARIFAIVDVWDALNSQRPYRNAWPEREVRAYIEAQAGKQFDPRLVEAFMKLVSERELKEGYG